ncbi:hypothetical protein FG379_001935 [Cryptosporidium bovis]|uniref:uncharacterized protein n=1 Tax=Cryptosporidium bovis TaxID=310047 RepID=UPI00351A2799|nr:hypothetical protein FG379_001935 [Cryptosporidium bovis]
MCSNNGNSENTGEMVTLLHKFKTELETVLSRENILRNDTIRSYFDAEVMGISLDSILKLKNFKKFENELHKLFDCKPEEFGNKDEERSEENDNSSNKEVRVVSSTIKHEFTSTMYYKELMHAIVLAATISPQLDICVMGDCNKKAETISFGFNAEKEVGKVDLSRASKELSEFVGRYGARRIHVKPKLEGGRTTLIVRDLDDDTSICREEIYELLINCPHIAEFNGKRDGIDGCVLNVKKEIEGTWFITLSSEDLTKKVVLWLREQSIRGKKLKVGVKSEHKIASFLSMMSNSCEQRSRITVEDNQELRQFQIKNLTHLPSDSLIQMDTDSEMRNVVIAPHSYPKTEAIGMSSGRDTLELEAPIPPPQGENGFNLNVDGNHIVNKSARKSRRHRKKKKKGLSKINFPVGPNYVNNYTLNTQQYPLQMVYGYPHETQVSSIDTGFGTCAGTNDVSYQVFPQNFPHSAMFTRMGSNYFVSPISRFSAPTMVLPQGVGFSGNFGSFDGSSDEKVNDNSVYGHGNEGISRCGNCHQTRLFSSDDNCVFNHIQTATGNHTQRNLVYCNNTNMEYFGPNFNNIYRYNRHTDGNRGVIYGNVHTNSNDSLHLSNCINQGHEYCGAYNNVFVGNNENHGTNFEPKEEQIPNPTQTSLYGKNGAFGMKNVIGGSGVHHFNDNELKRLCFCNGISHIHYPDKHPNQFQANHYGGYCVNNIDSSLKADLNLEMRNSDEQERLGFNSTEANMSVKRCSNCELVIALYNKLSSRLLQGGNQQQCEDYLMRLLMKGLAGFSIGDYDNEVKKKGFVDGTDINGNDSRVEDNCDNNGKHRNTEVSDNHKNDKLIHGSNNMDFESDKIIDLCKNNSSRKKKNKKKKRKSKYYVQNSKNIHE